MREELKKEEEEIAEMEKKVNAYHRKRKYYLDLKNALDFAYKKGRKQAEINTAKDFILKIL